MYAVIFKAEIKHLDAAYHKIASRMWELACAEFGCTEFSSAREGANELAIFPWPNLLHIKNWKQNTEHLPAQKFGRSRWHKSYSVRIVELLRKDNRDL